MTESLAASRMIGGRHYQIDADPSRLDVALIHHFLAKCSHWARNIPLDTLRRAIAHSLAFGLYRDGAQIGFARVVTDQATFAYLADVFVVAEERNAGLGQWLIETILAHPPLQGLRRWLLVTKNAKRLYCAAVLPNCARISPIWSGSIRRSTVILCGARSITSPRLPLTPALSPQAGRGSITRTGSTNAQFLHKL